MENLPVRCTGIIDSIRPTLIGQLSKIASETIQFPEASTIITGLTVASHIAGLVFKTEYQSNGSHTGIMLNTIVEQPPSASKTRTLKVFDGELNFLAEMENERRIKERCRMLASLGKSEISESQQKMLNELQPLTVEFSDITIEAAQDAARENNGYLSLRDSEQDLITTCFGNIYKTGDSKTSGKGLMLKGFDLDRLTIKRVNSERTFSVRVSVGVMIIAQDGTSSKILGSSGGTGFAERFNFWSEPEVEVDYVLRNRGGNNPKAMDGIAMHYNERVRDIFEIYRQNKIFGIDTLKAIKISPRANDMIGEWQNDTAKDYKKSPVLFSRFGKSLSIIHRIAATLWLFDISVDKDAGQTLMGKLEEHRFTVPDSFVETALEVNIHLLCGTEDILMENGSNQNEEAKEAIIKLAEETKKAKLTKAAFTKKIKNRAPFKRNPELFPSSFQDLIDSNSIMVMNNFVTLMG